MRTNNKQARKSKLVGCHLLSIVGLLSAIIFYKRIISRVLFILYVIQENYYESNIRCRILFFSRTICFYVLKSDFKNDVVCADALQAKTRGTDFNETLYVVIFGSYLLMGNFTR